MATIALSAAGNAFGGPIGGSIGALIGQQIDEAIFGGSSREGPRIDDLKITTSSYGAPLPKHFGRTRIAGSIIWATDLREESETSGGKGKPKTTTFSYSMSLAVALSSRPIARLGRIWADGNLLRGANEDLKVGGAMRLYRGYGDQPVDPLLAAAHGSRCPAFRGSSYVVFEDLQLEEFGNRLPALSFEIFADEGAFSLSDIIEPLAGDISAAVDLDRLTGFSYSGGTLASAANLIGELYPISARADRSSAKLSSDARETSEPIILPESMPARANGEFGQADGQSRQRVSGQRQFTSAIRYYDASRDYQSGVQRPDGRANLTGNRVVEFPGTLTPDNARLLVNRAASRDVRSGDVLQWRMAELDPALSPGQRVIAPSIAGEWLVSSWEWRDDGIELELNRPPLAIESSSAGDFGSPAIPVDDVPFPTRLRAFELPWDGLGSPYGTRVFAAASAEASHWSGAALFVGSSGALTPIGASGRQQATMGSLASPLGSSSGLLIEPKAAIEVDTVSDSMAFASKDLVALANGQNRLLIGDEILQFATALPLGSGRWRLTGLLRGRAGSETAAAVGHPVGTPVTAIDNSLIAIEPDQLPPTGEQVISAIGKGDEEPATAGIANRGAALRPLTPVHPRVTIDPIAGLDACWTRRARGAWRWIDGVEVPLVEAVESYRVGIGGTDSPDVQWQVDEPVITLTNGQVAEHSGAPLWVAQIGSESLSEPLLLAILP